MGDTEPTTLAGQTVLVTGAARRIGAAIATAMHEEGARVAIHYRRSTVDADALAADLNAVRENSAKTFCADLVTDGAPETLVAEVLDWSGRLDILVNNASTFYPTPLGTITAEQWLDLIGSNLKAPLFLSQAAAPHLAAYGGCIINIVDIHARRPLREHIVYGAAKAGLAMLTRSLARELAPSVRVNGVAPGAIAWPENDMSESVKEHIVGQVPLGRSGAPADIARSVLFLARDATYSTGQILTIDGGRSIGW